MNITITESTVTSNVQYACASCAKQSTDATVLDYVDCALCKTVRYCCVECREAHKTTHSRICALRQLKSVNKPPAHLFSSTLLKHWQGRHLEHYDACMAEFRRDYFGLPHYVLRLDFKEDYMDREWVTMDKCATHLSAADMIQLRHMHAKPANEHLYRLLLIMRYDGANVIASVGVPRPL